MYRTICTNVQWKVLNYTVSPQNSEPKNLQQHASVLSSQSFLETTTLKTILTSAVKRRELIDFTIFFRKRIYV